MDALEGGAGAGVVAVPTLPALLAEPAVEPGAVAEPAVEAGAPVGLLTWLVDPDGTAAEIRALAVDEGRRREGIGRSLLDAARAVLRTAGVRRLWLVTTNDNLAALALYQRAGWRLAALRAGAVDEARRTLKPSIPEVGEHSIPIRDELELELELRSEP